MSTPFLGEIRMFTGNFAPRGWAFCDGRLMDISQNDALFSLLGTIYGGDGRNTFALPDMRGRIPIHAGTGLGLTQRRVGEKAGSEKTALNPNHLPPHRHVLRVSGAGADAKNPRRRLPGLASEPLYAAETASPQAMHAEAIGRTGGGIAHTNLMPYVCVNFIIALTGIYPSRS